MDSQETPAQKHVCGVCHDEWLTEQEYLNHACPGTGFKPTEPEHLIGSTQPDFADVQKAALERGLEQINPDDQVAVAHQLEALEQAALTDTPQPPADNIQIQ